MVQADWCMQESKNPMKQTTSKSFYLCGHREGAGSLKLLTNTPRFVYRTDINFCNKCHKG